MADEREAGQQYILGGAELRGWYEILHQYPPLADKQHQELRNLNETIRDFIDNTDDAMALGELINANGGIPTEDQQRRNNRDIKRFYDDYYTLLSRLAKIMSVFPKVFPNAPFSNNTAVLKYLRAIVPQVTEQQHDLLDYSRQYRDLRAHPSQSPTTNWFSYNLDEGHPMVITNALCGSSHDGKKKPKLATMTDRLPIDGDWWVPAPDMLMVNVVVRLILERVFLMIADWLYESWDARRGTATSATEARTNSPPPLMADKLDDPTDPTTSEDAGL